MDNDKKIENDKEAGPAARPTSSRRMVKVLGLALATIGLFVAGVICGSYGHDQFVKNKLAPIWALGMFMDADESYESGQWQSATLQLNESIVFQPEWYAPHLLLGKIYVENGYYELADMHLAMAEMNFNSSTQLDDTFRKYTEDLDEIERLQNLIPLQGAAQASEMLDEQ